MAQTTNLAAGTSGGTSTDIVVAADATATIGIFPGAAAAIPADMRARLTMDSPGDPVTLAVLDKDRPVVRVEGPGTFNVVVPANAAGAVGVFSE